MTREDLDRFKHIWLVDFEYRDAGGPTFDVHCVAAKDLHTGQTVQVWQPAGESVPYTVGADSLFVAYNAIAEMRCHLSLNWPIPKNILDLYPEFRLSLCGLVKPEESHRLLRALTHYGIEGLEESVKAQNQELAIRGAPFTEAEKSQLSAYNLTDVDATEKLLPKMMPDIDLPRALIRGRYMAASAQVEANGIPIDTQRLGLLRQHWEQIKQHSIADVDKQYRVHDGTTFKVERFVAWLSRIKIAWPTTPSGRPALDADTFRFMAKFHPQLENLRELRELVSRLRLHGLHIGPDGRNRYFLNPFKSVTGRNQPSNTASVYGPSRWIRGLIKPPEGKAVAYIDWEQQEFGIAAALSKDTNMMQAYRSGDPYLAFGKQAGAIPPDGTKETHKVERKQFKQAALGIQYGMGREALGLSLGGGPAYGQKFIQLHRDIYPQYWRYVEAIQDKFLFHGKHTLSFGWAMRMSPIVKVTTVRNFPFQGNGAEMLRLAIILAVERGVKVCAPIHDALLIEAPLDGIEEAVAMCEQAMRAASELVLPGFPLRTEHVVVRCPDRYMDEAGKDFWDKIWAMPFMQEALRTSGTASDCLHHPGPNCPDTADAIVRSAAVV